MRMTQREKSIARLSAEMIREERAKGIISVRDFGLTKAESLFKDACRTKRPGASVTRHGWPDFLIEHEGKIFGVEVKDNTDDMRPGQRRMFAMLERAGIRVFIWHPREPDRLVLWSRWTRPLMQGGPPVGGKSRIAMHA